MSDLARYFDAQEKRRRWMAERENASARLQLAQIHERAAEIRSQHEPLNELTGGDRDTREKILAATFYVLHGRFPEKQSS